VGAAKRVLSAINSPWFWPVIPLLAIAAVGQWVSVTAAEVVAAGFAAIGIGVLIGLAVAGGRRGVRHTPDPTRPAATPASTAPVDVAGTALPRATDLRGAMLANTTLVRADLRHADLRGATLTGADLSGADLTDARLGLLEESGGSGPPPDGS
jgi:hypothetical protein